MRESFVLHAEYILDLPPEVQNKWLRYVFNYGILGIEPENLTTFENVVWIKIKNRIISDCAKYDKKTKVLSISNEIRSVKAKLKDATGTYKEGLEEMLQLLIEKKDKAIDSYTLTPNGAEQGRTAPNGSHTERVSLSVSDSVSVFDSLYISDLNAPNGSRTEAERSRTAIEETPLVPNPEAQKDFASKIHKIFKDAGLSVDENEVTFQLSSDFKDGLSIAMKKDPNPEHIIKACENYASVYNKPGYIVTFFYSFYTFVKNPHFIDYLPQNFKKERYLDKKDLQGRQAVWIDDRPKSYDLPDNSDLLGPDYKKIG